MRVLVAPDSAGGTLDPAEMAAAIADGWRSERPADEVTELPLSDGGEGLIAALLAGALGDATVRRTEVVGPRGLATDAAWLLTTGGTAVIESALACGLALVAPAERDPLRATTWGVGQLLAAARDAGATRVLVGLGGSATVDGGAGALSALGFGLRVADGSGLKIGGEDLRRVRGAARTWVAEWGDVAVELLADVTDPLMAAPSVYGPQKGADAAGVAHLDDALRAWRAVVERDLGAAPSLALAPGTGAAGGLGYGLTAGIGARLVAGADAVAELVGLEREVARADLVITGEGRLDVTSTRGKVVSRVAAAARSHEAPLALVVGCLGTDVDAHALVGATAVVEAAPDGPGDDPAAEVAVAAARLAAGHRRTGRGGRDDRRPPDGRAGSG